MAHGKKSASQSGSPVTRKPAVKAPRSGNGAGTGDRRIEMIQEAAYFRALGAGFDGDPEAHWLAAEREIDALLGRR